MGDGAGESGGGGGSERLGRVTHLDYGWQVREAFLTKDASEGRALRWTRSLVPWALGRKAYF